MRLGFFLPTLGPAAGPDAMTDIARRAEERGFDSLWVTERTLWPLEPQVPYVATADGSLPEAFRSNLDPVASLAYIAGQTSRISIGTSVLNLPWYNPVLLARALTTVDIVSKGRLWVGFGMGWSPDEYEAAGAPWRRRGRRMDENLEAIKAIWTTDPVEYQGSGFRIPRSIIGPKPVQKPHPPICMAAYTEAALARTARVADAWMPVGVPLAAMSGMFEGVRSMAEQHGRDPAAMELIVRANAHLTDSALGEDRFPFTGTLDQIRADVIASREAGAAEIAFDPTFDPAVRTPEDFASRLDMFQEVATAA